MTAPADSAAAPPEPATPTARIGHEERDVVLRCPSSAAWRLALAELEQRIGALSDGQALEDQVRELLLGIPRAEAVFPPAS